MPRLEPPDPGDVDLPALIESNTATFLLQMGAAGGGVERSDEQVTWTIGGSPIGYHNAVVRFDVGDPERAAVLIALFREQLQARGLPGSWHLTPTMRPTDLGALLQAAGFEDGGEEPAMAADLAAGIELPPSELTVSRVEDVAGMGDYREVLAGGFGEGPKEADWVATVFSAIGHGAGWSHFVGRINGVPVATASLLLTNPVGGIYFVCTSPEHRRRGYGAAITRHAMSVAESHGATHTVLGSSPMGQGVYEALGFRTIFTYRLMEWEQ